MERVKLAYRKTQVKWMLGIGYWKDEYLIPTGFDSYIKNIIFLCFHFQFGYITVDKASVTEKGKKFIMRDETHG